MSWATVKPNEPLAERPCSIYIYVPIAPSIS